MDNYTEDSLKNVKSVMKNILPTNFTIDDDALALMKSCVLDFVSSMSCEVASNCVYNGKNSVTGHDVVSALANIGYNDYSQPMSIYASKISSHPSVLESVRIEPVAASLPSPATKPAIKKKANQNNNTVQQNKKPKTPLTFPRPKIDATSSTNSYQNSNAFNSAGTVATSSSSGSGSSFQERVNLALDLAIRNPTCDLKQLASQVPVSFHYFADRLQQRMAR